MLDEYKVIYEDVARVGLPNWKTINKNDLIRVAADLKNGPDRDSYVAAIMLNYWNKISKFYSKCKLVATPEDVHTWLTMSVMYALDKKPWEVESSSIYNDPNGPDKVINRCMECRRITFYQQLNRYNRKINSLILSLDSITEERKDSAAPAYTDFYLFEVHNIVTSQFLDHHYVSAIMLNGVLYDNWKVSEEDYKKIANQLKKVELEDAEMLSERYNVTKSLVEEAIMFCNYTSVEELRRRAEYSAIKLRELIKEVH